MKKMVPAASPTAYVAALKGWQKSLVAGLRRAALAAAPLEERIKWGNLVYFSDGPVLVIHTEEERVVFGFWRGHRLRDIDQRLKPGGKYEMANIVLLEGDRVTAARVKQLVRAAVALNQELGDPTAVAGTRR